MSKATVAKLAVLIFLAFIICLPEFFPSNTVVQIQFHCLPFDPCDTMGGPGPEDGQICEVYRNGNRTKPLCEAELKKNPPSRDGAVKRWFVCESQADLRGLLDNASLSEVDVDAVLMLQVPNQTLQNVTVHSHFNHSGLHIETHLNFMLLGCCTRPQRNCTHPDKVKTPPTDSSTPSPATHQQLSGKTDSTSDPLCQSNGNECIFHYAGSNVLKTYTKVRWWGFSTAVWLILVLIVFVLVLLSVWVEVYANRCCCQKRPALVPVRAHQAKRFSKRRIKSLGDLPNISISVWSTEDEELFLEELPKDYSRDKHHQAYQKIFKRGLSIIHEVSMTDMPLDEEAEEKKLDGTVKEGSDESLNFDQAPAHTQSLPCLHHRGHPSHSNEEESA